MRAPRPPWRRLQPAIVALFLVALTGCQPAPPATPDWSSMTELLGDWTCEAHFQTPQGDLAVPMVTVVARGMGGRWMEVHREAPGWNAASGRFVEDAYTGWDRRRGQWVTTVHNNFGVTGYLTSTGFHAGVASWDEHPFTDISLPLRSRTVWRKPAPNEWIAEMRTGDPTRSSVTLTSEHCLKKDATSF